MKNHNYEIKVQWKGNTGHGTKSYDTYKRNHIISGVDKAQSILGSSDQSFRGNPNFYNPEELFLSSISTCHMLWYLHLCSVNKINVKSYLDIPLGKMVESKDGSGHFESVLLRPFVLVSKESDPVLAKSLQHKAHTYCFIANSCNFPIKHDAKIELE